MSLIDSHAHIYLENFQDDLDQVIKNALEKNVKKILLPNIDSSTYEAMMKTTEEYPDICLPMMGIHPCSINADFQKELKFAKDKLLSGQFIAIGEIGIDLYWDKTFVKEQKEAFKIQCEWAKEMSFPIVIHARDSFQEIFEVLDEVNDEHLTGVFHCFTGGLDELNKIRSYGDFLVGIGGVLTFKNSGLDEVLKEIELSEIIVETDSPYLAPSPHRGKRNEPAYTSLVADRIATIKNIKYEEVCAQTTANAEELFGL